MDVKIEESWKEALKAEFGKSYFAELAQFVKNEYRDSTVYPPPKFIFNAFALTPFNKVKVVILGQDPYHGTGQANGLCFAVGLPGQGQGVALPPSLQNIFKEMESDLGQKLIHRGGDLGRWAKQGVLLLNATLTVRANAAGSHQNKGWEQFTDAVVRALNYKKEHLVFVLWGNYAKQKGAHIDRTRHLVVESAHPSPFAAAHGFFGSKPFSKTNVYLTSHGEAPIDWL